MSQGAGHALAVAAKTYNIKHVALQIPALATSLADVEGVYQAQEGKMPVLGATLRTGLASFVAAALSGGHKYRTHETLEQTVLQQNGYAVVLCSTNVCIYRHQCIDFGRSKTASNVKLDSISIPVHGVTSMAST